MKKLFFAVLVFLLILTPITMVLADGGLVPCNGTDCDICKFFEMLVNIYKFITTKIAGPLAVVALIVGGVFMMASAGNPNWHATGKKIIYSAILGLVLVLCSWLIIDIILKTVGFNFNGGNWFSLNLSC